VTKDVIARAAGVAVIAVAMVVTVAANCFTVSQIFHGATRVPWADEWPILQQFIEYHNGSPLWPILWRSHWGHRFVIPRLVYFADVQWAAHAPLIWLTLSLQAILIAQICALSWILIGRRSRLLFAASLAVILNLMLSPLQMENFVWSMQFTFPLVYAAACTSFMCLAAGAVRTRSVFLPLAIAAAVVASLSMANGILVWPVLTAQAAGLRLPRRVTIAIAAVGAAIIAAYCSSYPVPPIGMGLSGMLRHPLDASLLIGLLLGGALNPISPPLGIGASLLALAGAGYLGWKQLAKPSSARPWLLALVALLVFVLMSAATTVAGRMSPQWLSRNTPVPSRLFTMVQLFWAVLAILILYGTSRKSGSRHMILPYGALYLSLMFLNPQRQISAAKDWPDFLRGVDAVGAALVAGVPDEQFLSTIWPVDAERDAEVSFLREKRLSVFAEPRAAWLGRRVSELFPTASADRCIGEVERARPIEQSPAETSWRVEGWAWNASASRAFDYLLIADPKGIVTGLARGGFRHRYFPGFFTEDQSALPPHERFKASEWLGYVRQPVKSPWTVYGLQPRSNQVCAIQAAAR
jgi:hypothetical protein